MKRSKWIDKLLQDSNLKKIALNVEANYLERLKRLNEDVRAGKTKWSSIEEALEDFADRNKFSRKQMQILVKEANIADDLQDEGLGSQAIEYMSKTKGKHTDDSASPFSLSPKDKWLKDQIKKEEESKRELKQDDVTDEDTNEMKHLDASSAADLLYRRAQEGKIVNIPGVGEESMEELQKELGSLDIKVPYKIIRHGFRFRGMKDNELSQEGEPVKVTVYQYSFYKKELADEINERLREQLAQELPIEDWLEYLKANISPKARAIQSKLEQLQRDLYSEEAAFVETKRDVTPAKNIRKVMQMFPISYQKEILRLLAEGAYRHLTSEEGRKHAEIYATRYQKGSFVLMESFDPYVKIVPQFQDADQARSFLEMIKNTGKNTFTAEEFAQLVDSANIPYQEIPTSKGSQVQKLGPVKIRVENKQNENYRPMTNQLSTEELSDPDLVEEQLQKFQDKLASVLMQDISKLEKASETGKKVQLTPLAYEPQPDGSYKPLNLLELGKKDYTAQKINTDDEQSVENPTAGVHPSYQGSFDQISSQKGSPLGKRLQPRREKPSTPTEEGKEEKSRPKTKWEEYMAKSKGLGKYQKNLSRAIIRFAGLDIWVSDRGRVFSSEDTMRAEMYDTFVKEYEDDIVELAVNQLSDLMAEPETGYQKPTEPEETQEEEIVEEPIPETEEFQQEDQSFAPAASTKIDFTKFSSNTKVKLARLFSKYKR